MYEDQQPQGCLEWFAFKRWLLFQTNRSVKISFRIISIILIAIGGLTLFIMVNIPEAKAPYSVRTSCLTQSKNNKCSQTIELTKDFPAPIQFLYYIENIYINHRKYMDSQSPAQLQGNAIDTKTAIKECAPIVYNKDLYVNKSWAGNTLDPQGIASPCGLKALFYFNDTYRLYDQNGKEIPINTTGVSLNINQNLHRFKRSGNSEKEQWINPEDQHFVNWMQTQSLMTKKKLWGRIQQTLKKGVYTVLVQNNYQVGDLKITKGVELTSASFLGGRQLFIPSALIFLGLASWIYTIYLGYKFDQYQQLLRNYRASQ